MKLLMVKKYNNKIYKIQKIFKKMKITIKNS